MGCSDSLVYRCPNEGHVVLLACKDENSTQEVVNRNIFLVVPHAGDALVLLGSEKKVRMHVFFSVICTVHYGKSEPSISVLILQGHTRTESDEDSLLS